MRIDGTFLGHTTVLPPPIRRTQYQTAVAFSLTMDWKAAEWPCILRRHFRPASRADSKRSVHDGMYPSFRPGQFELTELYCKGALGKPFTTVGPHITEGQDWLGRELRMKWSEHYEAEGIQNFLSE